MSDRPILVSSADRRYAMPLAVMLRSAVENCSSAGGLDIRVLDGGLGRRARRRVERSLPAGKCTLRFLDVRAARQKLRGAPVFGHVSLATYYRFLIPSLVPESKVIYVDADAVVLGDLARLWAEPVGEYHLLGVQEGTVTNVCTIAGLEDYGVAADHPRLSAGVLVMNLSKWRSDNPVPNLMRYLRMYGERVTFWDQDALNVVMARRWGRVAGAWNFLVDCSLAADESPAEVVARLHREAEIVHYASATKPWHYYVEHPAKILFFEYLARTEWGGWRPRPPLRALRNRHYLVFLMRRLGGVCRFPHGSTRV